MEDIFLVSAICIAAIFGVLLGAIASYTARIRDESERTGKPIEQLFSKNALHAEVAIAGFIGLLSVVAAFVIGRRYLAITDTVELTAFSIGIGSMLSFFNRSTIILARQYLPDALKKLGVKDQDG